MKLTRCGGYFFRRSVDFVDTNVRRGEIYYADLSPLILTGELRQRVKESVAEMHRLMLDGRTPKAKMGKACKSCSLVEICQPKLMKQVSASEYIRRAFHGEDEE